MKKKKRQQKLIILSCSVLAVLGVLSIILFLTPHSHQGESFSRVTSGSQAKDSEMVKNVPIIMYHGLIKETSLQTDYLIDATLFETDLLYLQSKGYTPVFMADLINYTKGHQKLPKKPIVLTFDDGYYNNYHYAYPLLREFRMKAHFSIIGRFTDEYSQVKDSHIPYSHMKWKQLEEMALSGYCEIGNHSYNLHEIKGGRKGIKKLPGETEEAYRKAIVPDLCQLQKKIKMQLGYYPLTFTYPFGASGELEEKTVRSLGFAATLSCREGINVIEQGNPECLFDLCRYLRENRTSSEEFFTKRGII